MIHTDSLSAMHIVKHQACTSKSNHLVKYYHYLFQEVEAGNVALRYITADDQVADLLTKPLAAEAHANLSDKLLHGFRGLEPRPGSVATPHQLRLRQLSRMRAARKRLQKPSSLHLPLPMP